jgi:1,4-alpha-glucan branching enzyme
MLEKEETMATRTPSKPGAKSAPAKKTVPLVVRIAGVREVAVTGDFTNWSAQGVALSQIRDGEWAVNLDLSPGEHQYRLRVDGEWRDDPAARRHVPNPFGGENCVLTV